MPILDELQELTGPWGRIKRGLSVAISGIDFAVLLKGDPIGLIGIDLAYQVDAAYAENSEKKEIKIIKKNDVAIKQTFKKEKMQEESLEKIQGNSGREAHHCGRKKRGNS